MPRLDQRLGFTRYEADEYYRRALEQFRKGAFDSAIDSLNDALDLLPTRSEYYAARGLIYFEDGEPSKARGDFEAALKHFEYEMLAHFGLGMLAYQDGDWEAAGKHFLAAARIDPNRAETQYYLALVYARLGQLEQASEWMTKAAAGLEAASHPSRADANRWLRELEKLLKAANRPKGLFDALETSEG